MLLSHFTIGVFLTLTYHTVDAFDKTNHPCPLPLCSECPIAKDVYSEGVGFDLSASYGTAAIGYRNGSVVNVGKLDASPAYQSLMKQLSEKRRGQLSSRFESIRDDPAHGRESSQRRLSTPYLLDIEPISLLISELKTQTEGLLGHSIHSVAVSSPDYIGLSNAEISEATEYLGLRNLAGQNNKSLFSVDYSGYSTGIVPISIYPNACEGDEEPSETVLRLDYTGTTLSGSLSLLQRGRLQRTDNSFVDWYLGLERKPRFIEEEAYWDLLWRRIRRLVQEPTIRGRLKKIILTGDAINIREPRFFREVRDALRGIIDPFALDTLESNSADAVFAAARGAAEFAKRYQEGPVGCLESDECRALRESV
ncbi:hypothetical protein AJ79_06479 [Helicocarpus griseus UAMH5409]|uniref:Actin-like ATPase domain-containing protein n=1 Tax=Helicocarpus griseus UAMH5409 TaxID=1447875 RepID=A0A2B7XCL4_9EURO|nr:hypothetical protein AJ79_06479 [Helicocarpus griseus UAMH5409]